MTSPEDTGSGDSSVWTGPMTLSWRRNPKTAVGSFLHHRLGTEYVTDEVLVPTQAGDSCIPETCRVTQPLPLVIAVLRRAKDTSLHEEGRLGD